MIPALLAAALVWLPPESFNQWTRLDAVLRARADVRLTIGLTPEMATPQAKAALAPWIAAGRVEIAARVPGDPVLPLAAAHPFAPRPDDALERAAQARQELDARLGSKTQGFVLGAGALEPSLIGPLGASGASWILAGPYVVWGSTWAAEGRTLFVPARKAALEELATPGALVVDESAEAAPRLLAALASAPKPAGGWTTISSLAAAAAQTRLDAATVAAWPGWDGAVVQAPADPSARAAWTAYGEAARALARYQNSGMADLKILEDATALLRKAQDARFFRAPASGAPAGLPADLRARLIAVYKRLKAPAPESLYAGAAPAAGAADETPTGVRAKLGLDWVQFDNPLGTIARAPAGAPNADPWRLRGLRVEWDDGRVLFRLQPARVDAAPAPPAPIYDVYIDLNHVAGAGSLRTFEGRGVFAQARDAWEFAIAVSGPDAKLWRARGGADPEEVATLKAEPDPANAEIKVAVPRSLLRGNPARWGYIALALADGSPTLGLLAPLEVQKAVLEHVGPPQRVSAARIEAVSQP